MHTSPPPTCVGRVSEFCVEASQSDMDRGAAQLGASRFPQVCIYDSDISRRFCVPAMPGHGRAESGRAGAAMSNAGRSGTPRPSGPHGPVTNVRLAKWPRFMRERSCRRLILRPTRRRHSPLYGPMR